mmetsp:Transcript_25207/g.69501  ORF Transcript_25207/g.69501 Transcript_25207/m.69501 type:complete len:562 (-) Transcript_25207:247-1932(-)
MEAMDAITSMGMGMGTGTQAIANITGYDVLVDPPVEGVVGEYQLDNYGKNVGNNRLKVFLTLYKQDYDRARRQNDVGGCESIVKDIIHTLNTKCVPTGRFLLNAVSSMKGIMNGSHRGQMNVPIWNLMGEDDSKRLIHGILCGVPPPLSYRFWQQQIQDHQLGAQNNGCNSQETDELKRRRRSSLLRRSASDSLLDDSKKVSRFDQQQQQQFEGRRMSKEEPIWSSCRRSTSNGIVSLNRMDVILTSNREALDPNCQSIGNNRLHILVAMQSGKYQLANYRQKDAILDEVMQTVNSFWKGRFLTESLGGSYEVLDNADAKRALRNIFDMRSGQNLFTQPSSQGMNITPNTISSGLNNSQLMGNSSGSQEFNNTNSGNDVNNGSGNGSGNNLRNSLNRMKQVSTSSLQPRNGNNISNDTKRMLSRQMSTSLLPNQLSSSTLSRIEPPVAVSGIDDLRSAAIKSLQKQKARQQVANRLEKVSMRTSQQKFQQPFQIQIGQNNGMSNTNGVHSNDNNFHNIGNASFPSYSMGGGAKRRQSSIFGALDSTVMDEIVGGCFDDEDD